MLEIHRRFENSFTANIFSTLSNYFKEKRNQIGTSMSVLVFRSIIDCHCYR